MNIFLLLFYVVIGGFVLWILFIIFIGRKLYKFQKGQEKKSMKSHDEMNTFLNDMTKKLSVYLKPWSAGDLEKMTLGRVKAFSRGKFYTQTTRGILVDEDGNPKIVYALIDNSKEFTKAITRITTTAFAMELFYDENGFEVRVDGQVLGQYIQDKRSAIRIYDKFQQHIGVVQRNVGYIERHSIDLIFKEINLYYKNTNEHHLIGFASGFRAELTNRLAKDARTLALSFDQKYTTEQEKWLIALMVHEVTALYEDSLDDYYD